ncbi:MAG: hypothetical protein IPN71_23710 [Fibrobacteres bacterium]|jgi:GT2 family glycosyltransferase|nr:hypothetical protein [Fibrobacterota bacterium]
MPRFCDSFPATILVVLYKQEPLATSTVRGILAARSALAHGTKLVLWDNGPVAARELPESSDTLRIEYVHTPENLSLSKVYNRVAEGLPSEGVLLVLDQDTGVVRDFFEAMAQALQERPEIDLFLPLVRSASSGILVSPGSQRWIKGKYWKTESVGIMPSKGVLAVASGIVARSRLFGPGGVRFDERLSLYMIDTKFMMDHASIRPSLFVVSHVLRHGDSAEEVEPVATKLFRFQNRMRAGAILFSTPWTKCVAYRLYWVWCALRQALLHREPKFLRP